MMYYKDLPSNHGVGNLIFIIIMSPIYKQEFVIMMSVFYKEESPCDKGDSIYGDSSSDKSESECQEIPF